MGCGEGGGLSRVCVGWAEGNLSAVPYGNPAQPGQRGAEGRPPSGGPVIANTSLSQLSLENEVSGCP